MTAREVFAEPWLCERTDLRLTLDESLPEHAVQADQYIPALVCQLAADSPVCLVTADVKLRRVVREIVDNRVPSHPVDIEDPLSVLLH